MASNQTTAHESAQSPQTNGVIANAMMAAQAREAEQAQASESSSESTGIATAVPTDHRSSVPEALMSLNGRGDLESDLVRALQRWNPKTGFASESDRRIVAEQFLDSLPIFDSQTEARLNPAAYRLSNADFRQRAASQAKSTALVPYGKPRFFHGALAAPAMPQLDLSELAQQANPKYKDGSDEPVAYTIRVVPIGGSDCDVHYRGVAYERISVSSQITITPVEDAEGRIALTALQLVRCLIGQIDPRPYLMAIGAVPE